MANTKVILVNGKEEREFDLSHAERILAIQKRSRITTGWQLKPNSGYELKDGTISLTNTGATKDTKKQLGDSGSDKP